MNLRTPSIFALAAGLLLLAGVAEQAAAQVRVDISFKRKLYVMYEPLIATVTINNLSGRPLLLENSDHHRWFGFNIETAEGRIVPPIHADYALAPAAVGPGEKLTRAVNLTPLFPLHDFGLYRVKATVYVPSFDRYFSSPPLAVEITDGRPIWQEVVGVPGNRGKPELRTITLLAHKLSRSTRLYVRIEDRENGRVFATHQLGQGLAGEILGQQAYLERGSRPSLVKDGGGEVKVVGGNLYVPGQEEAEAEAADKAGDRPVPLPGS